MQFNKQILNLYVQTSLLCIFNVKYSIFLLSLHNLITVIKVIHVQTHVCEKLVIKPVCCRLRHICSTSPVVVSAYSSIIVCESSHNRTLV